MGKSQTSELGLRECGAAIALQNVTCKFGAVTALQSVSVAIAPAERVAIVGPSGAGKSTLLGLMNGSLSPTAGEVEILGQPILRLNAWQRRQIQRQIGTVHQQQQLVDNLSVIHNVNAGHLGRWPFWKALWSLVWPQEVATAQQALDRLGIGDKIYARSDRLSGGQQQRVALARMLVQNPRIVLADEPVASVDPARAHDIMGLLCDLASERTLVVSLHNVELAKGYCDRIIGLRKGQILFDLPSGEVTDQRLTRLYALEDSVESVH
ncbi:MAG: phosphonate ABC transporter ATP-binding protein [Cyanobacteria bacterium J06634_6]